MRLYDSAPSGNCYKARLLLTQLGIPFERRAVDTRQRDGRGELLGGKNPALRVPVLELDDGRHLAESNAILWYLADGTQYLFDDPYERAKTLQWMSSSSTTTSRTSPSSGTARCSATWTTIPTRSSGAIEATQRSRRWNSS